MARRKAQPHASRTLSRTAISVGTPVREPLHCTECAQPITVLYVPGGKVQNLYDCPLCKAVIEVAVPGTLIDWWAGHEGHGPDPETARLVTGTAAPAGRVGDRRAYRPISRK